MYISHRRKTICQIRAIQRQVNLENEQNLYLAPISSVENSRKMLNRIAAMIRHFCEIQQHQKELEEQEKKLRSERKNRELLEANLKHIEGSVINLKINNHFLFNTLNQMAAMAVGRRGYFTVPVDCEFVKIVSVYVTTGRGLCFFQ